MAKIASDTTYHVVQIMTDTSTGLAPMVAEFALDAGIAEPPLKASHVIPRNVSPEIAEKSTGAVYPSFHVYCDKVNNALREKFRTFSGTARLVVEVRASQDRLENLEQRLGFYVDGITGVLDANRGDWGLGMFYTGGYDIAIAPVRHGGRNFLQIAKVSFDVQVSRD
jgi:hypothetical protein